MSRQDQVEEASYAALQNGANSEGPPRALSRWRALVIGVTMCFVHESLLALLLKMLLLSCQEKTSCHAQTTP